MHGECGVQGTEWTPPGTNVSPTSYQKRGAEYLGSRGTAAMRHVLILVINSAQGSCSVTLVDVSSGVGLGHAAPLPNASVIITITVHSSCNASCWNRFCRVSGTTTPDPYPLPRS